MRMVIKEVTNWTLKFEKDLGSAGGGAEVAGRVPG